MKLVSVALLVVIASNWMSVETVNNQQHRSSSGKKDVKTLAVPKKTPTRMTTAAPKRKVGPSFRIQGGNPVNDTTYPFVLAIKRVVWWGEVVICTAALIKENNNRLSSLFAMTAAHCVCHIEIQNGNPIPTANSTDDFRIYAGNIYADINTGIMPIGTRPKKIYCNPKWNEQYFAHDMAVIWLEVPFDFSETVGGIRLLDLSARDLPQNCKYASWGLIEKTDKYLLHSMHLQAANLTRTNSCFAVFRQNDKTYPLYLEQEHECFGLSSPAHACEGDSGSPIFCYFKDDKQPYLVAPLSHHIGPDPNRCGVQDRVLGPKVTTFKNYYFIQEILMYATKVYGFRPGMFYGGRGRPGKAKAKKS